ncbi:Por secretion system C-terminal sorting domain-containing protein [Chitinophaga sp. YR573]|uniref:S8 family peptidase n=1 Tax=Chitinophaga sp. YR573 TaxID=1881040 RepID=UPI0008B28006|nr:S8 family peptidase [Chitinophaga sp. YR573]SEV90816.1 Por secretion system C-terminal sorting domain-containing protein [Chitinophaga sp. YR573]
MKTIFVLFSLLLWQNISARQVQPPDSVALRYAAADTAARTGNSLRYYLVKFSVNPGNAVRNYGIIKTLSPFHYILNRVDFDTLLQRKVVYNYPANNNWKASAQLLQQLVMSDSLVLLAGVRNVSLNYCRVISQYGSVLRVSVQKKDWDNFITQPDILFLDCIRKAHTEILINNSDPAANAVNTAQQKYLSVRGKNITVSLKEDLLDTTDIDFTGRYIPSSFAATQRSSHATIMATMIGGAGNTGTKSLGAAPAVLFTSADFNISLMPEDPDYFKQFDITIQNHSYGTGIENYYGLEAAAYDEQVYNTDTLLHVFSSGNIGTATDSSGIYQGINGYANLSGTFKQAKNVLVAGGTDDSLHVVSLSSRGPAYDGRVKPELVAFGIDGTSGASAITSGVAALVQDAYKQKYGGAPSAALVKALLINSAVKVDHIPLSYKSGYGSLHALDALNTLSAAQFIKGSGSQQFTVHVPAGMEQLHVTLCWNDPVAALNASKALVNDLDLSVTDAAGQTYAPWVLSAAPSPDSLGAAAKRGRDSLNNIEQVTIDNPVAGDLQIHVHSPVAGQTFYVVYQWTPSHHFEWLNPGAHEVLYAGGNAPLPLRWQSNITGKGDLSYSIDSGITWNPLVSSVGAENGLYYWAVPSLFSAALLKFTMPDTSFISDTFFLSPRLTLQTGYDCGDSAFIYWSSVSDASAYEVYHLGEQYLNPYALPTDTFLAVSGGSPYFAVSPVHKDGWIGLKSYGTNYTVQGTGCYFRNLLADLNADGTVTLSLNLGTVYKLQHLYWQRLAGSDYVDISDQLITGVDYTYLDEHAPKGLVYYRVKLVTDDGKIIYSDPVPVYSLNDQQYLFFPNPVHSTLSVLSKELYGMQLQMYDMSGRLVLNKLLQDQLESLWIEDLPAGIYTVVLFRDGKKITAKKVVKQ